MRASYRDLFLISFLILFFELASIRWFAGTVVFLTFFTNIVLLACFVGMSVGLLSARRSKRFVRWSLPLQLLATALAMSLLVLYESEATNLTVSVGGQQTSPELIYFGTEYRSTDPSRWVVPIWSIAGAFFVLIALAFVGLGQVMGRAFDAIPDRVMAYTMDVLGSLSGIAAFACMSYFELPPSIWYVPIVLGILYFAGSRSALQIGAAVGTLVLIGISSHGLHGGDKQTFWSPYYKVSYDPDARRIDTNNIGHQVMMSVPAGWVYLIPHLLNRAAGLPPFEDELIIGAGSGNDVSAGLKSGVKRIDAVEIDPRINRLGRLHHPDRPYDDPRVAIRLDDGRSFMRSTERRFDLAVYALVDSLVLHTGYSSLRLENFLFTREAFEDVKRVLKPDGVFAMYNFYRQGWVVGRLAKLARDAFGTDPIVLSLPYRDEIKPGDSQSNQFTVVLAGADRGRLEAIAARFREQGSLWVGPAVLDGMPPAAFQQTSPGGDWSQLGPARVDASAVRLTPSDDWPQLYLRERAIPWAPIGQGMVTIGVLSLAILLAFAPLRTVRPNAQMFFLGAGFMLLEAKGVVHMAVLFGSTWVVNSVVFFAILTMILLANLYVLKLRPRNLLPYYALLLVALAVNALVPIDAFLSLPPLVRTLASCSVFFVPVFFAGVVFATSFRDSQQPDIDFGSNVAGIILGGLSEQLSLVLGFNHLVWVAAAYYVLSLALARRATG